MYSVYIIYQIHRVFNETKKVIFLPTTFQHQPDYHFSLTCTYVMARTEIPCNSTQFFFLIIQYKIRNSK